MGDLKPLGSEKLQGQEKIKRIMEIARYKENLPNNFNETSKSVYEIGLYDGNQYQIIKEKLGYVIKKTISESETDYLEPMKNRKYYSSYSQALKRLNLITKEVNRLNDIHEGQSLFQEQKKFVLKTPRPEGEEDSPKGATPPPPPPPSEPPPVPQPPLPPSPENEPPTDEMGMDDEMGGEEGVPSEPPTEEPEGEMEPEGEEMGGQEGEQEGVSFKSIQKLTGKLTQKIRDFENEKGLTSENIKYVINMVLSSLDLSSLSDEDKEDIMMKFDETEGEEDMEPDMEGDMEIPEPEGEMPPADEEMTSPETKESYGSILDQIFKESKIDKVISNYFDATSSDLRLEKKFLVERKRKSKIIVENKMKFVTELTETYEQELASKKFLEENPKFSFVGKTNKKNLVFEYKTKQIKISPEGYIL